MENYIIENLFIEDRVLFVSNKELNKTIGKVLNIDGHYKSYDFPTLWELKENGTNKEVFLHIDFGTDTITIQFASKDIDLLKKNLDVDVLGILINYNPGKNEAENVVFITNIMEGLNLILK